MARLAEIKNIVGIKEASASMDQSSDILKMCGDRITILSGDDALTVPLMALGAQGCHLDLQQHCAARDARSCGGGVGR